MNKDDFLEDFDQYIHIMKATTQKMLPYDTGNLANNAYKITRTADGYQLWLDKSVAYYVEYLDGNNFKHYDYLEWDDLVDFIIEQIKGRYGI